MKFGIKLWATNTNYIDAAMELTKEHNIDYVELYAVPGSYDNTIETWKKFKAPFIIHAPHSQHKVNLAVNSNKEENLRLLKDTFRFADALNAKYIVFHSGTAGITEEAASQLKNINDKRALIENKPFVALDKNASCNGNSPEEIKMVMKTANAGFCLDISHSICSANSHKIDPIVYLKMFLELKPKMYHFPDGKLADEIDTHDHFGNGNYPIRQIYSMIPKGSLVTIETVQGSDTKLDDFIKDVEFLKGTK